MNLNRRDFLLMSTACAACAFTNRLAWADTPGQTFDAGPVSAYAADGVYQQFSESGFFIIRQGEKLFALSSFCTHRRTLLQTEHNGTFYCQRHGSTFDPTGKVTEGPATQALPKFTISINAAGHLLVFVTA